MFRPAFLERHEVLPVDAATGRAFFRAAVAGAVAENRFISERMFLGMDRDVDYVASLLFHSAVLGIESQFSIWDGEVIRSSDIDLITRRISRDEIKNEDAQNVADQLLLRFGLFPKRISGVQASYLERCGGALYLKASRIYRPPLHDQLESMADNFLPWTEVLRAMKRRELLPIR